MNSQRTRSPTAGSSTRGRRGSQVKVICLDAVILDDRVDDQPALRVGRADHLDAEPLPDAARSPVAGDDIGRANFAAPSGVEIVIVTPCASCSRASTACSKATLTTAKRDEALEQDPLEVRLIEGAERRMAVEALRGSDRPSSALPRALRWRTCGSCTRPGAISSKSPTWAKRRRVSAS